ncbi:MAG: tRNA pseudouridine(54/55) synthase Pus10 [Planctomycetota bacterium]
MLPAPEEVVPRAIERCLETGALYEFTSFQVAIQGERRWEELPPEVVLAYKRELKVAVGGALERAWPARRVEFKRPHVLLIYSVPKDLVRPQVRPVCLYGRYRKLVRGLPQTPAPWKHPECKGKGCEGCAGTGRLHPLSLADLLGAPAAEAFAARGGYVLHGCGREDVDVRCLGGGRPFVLELRDPRRREVDLVALAETMRGPRAEVAGELRFTSEEAIQRLKDAEVDKRYLARCRADAALDPAAVAGLSALSGEVLEQRTPWRVARRRSDKVRRRRVRIFAPGALEPDGRTFCAEVAAQSGTYIKELISGDGGRTRPSVSELLGCAVECAELDVLGIEAVDEALLEGRGTAAVGAEGQPEPEDAGD